MIVESEALGHLDEIIATFDKYRSNSRHSDLGDIPWDEVHALIVRVRGAVERVAGSNSAYSHQVRDILARDNEHDWGKMRMVVGVCRGLRQDVASGLLTSIASLLHGEVFADFLDMAQHLVEEGYKDAAAVVAGSSLEAHIRQLCAKHGISTEVETPKGVRPKTADQMNADLAGAGVYSKLDQKSVTAWLGLRNNAAHGHYVEYGREQVALLVTGVRDFNVRNPA